MIDEPNPLSDDVGGRFAQHLIPLFKEYVEVLTENGYKIISPGEDIPEEVQETCVVTKQIEGLIVNGEWGPLDVNKVVELLKSHVHVQTCWGRCEQSEGDYEKHITLRKAR